MTRKRVRHWKYTINQQVQVIIEYSVCKDDKKCKTEGDRKMVKALDQVPYKDRQWGHWLGSNMVTKQKLGLGTKT